MSPLYLQNTSSSFNLLLAAILRDDVESYSFGSILVTGGGGFLGSHLVEAFATLPKVNQVIMTGQNPNRRRQFIPGAKFELCDVRDEEKTKALFAKIKPTTILHTISLGPFAAKKVQLEVTYTATKHLLKAAKEDPNLSAFVYTSSIEACSFILGRLDHPITEEEAPVSGLNSSDYWYFRAKGAADTMVRKANSPKPDDARNWSGYLLTLCVHIPGLYGPRDALITTALLSQLYIDNAVLGHVLAARKLLGGHHGVSGEAFFISDGKPMKLHTFTRSIFKETGDRNMNSPNPKFIVIPFWILYPLLALWEYIYQAATVGQKWPFVSRQNLPYIRKGFRISTENSRSRLKYEPLVGTEEGLRKTVAWFRENKAKTYLLF